MRVVLKHDVNRVKNGYSARSPQLGLRAVGYSPETAKLNLERMVLLYLKPFERQGRLDEEVAAAQLESEADEGDLIVVLTE